MGGIVATGLGKAYRHYPTRWARLAEWTIPGGRPRHQLKWVLRDIDFSVSPGEAVGIVGINGAGKSTLLKMITGTTQPTTGSVAISGRIAALLELGMGFHPDFTGRQNAYMAGQLLGMNVEEMARLMPGIEAFAEIGEYMDQPLRVYSSGMQMRLAFSVATARKPDILIVDEALSVGDAYFQHKSFDRIREFRNQGTTLLIVSHDRSAIQAICDRAILLEHGNIVKDGPPEEVMDFYNALIADKGNRAIEQTVLNDGKVKTISGTGEALAESIGLYNAAGDQVESVGVGEPVELRIQVKAKSDLPELVIGYMIKDRLGQAIFGTNTHHLGTKLTGIRSGDSFTYRFFFPANLGAGSYSITVALHSGDTHLAANYQWHDLALIFTVINIDQKHFAGLAWIPPKLEFNRE